MEIGIVKPVAIEKEMQSSYLDYAMSVIVSRALPDVRDGLKPVHRRILVTLHDLGLTHTAHYRKSAKICGDVSGNYHPHGEAIVYPSMARLAQDFNMRYPLVDGQGNFGSIDGDNPAAMRYTEARMTAIAEEMLADIDKDTVNWVDNYDSTRKEPVVLPARIPNLLINGSAGIAVGMATNIPPHNLGEVCDALAHMINRYGAAVEEGVSFEVMWARVHGQNVEGEVLQQALAKIAPALRQRLQAKALDLHLGVRKAASPEALVAVADDLIDIAPDELLAIVRGPDFPTAGLILGQEGITSAYTTGRGRVVLRAKAHIEEMRGGRYQIVVTELPFQVNKAALLEKIAELVRDKRIEGISDLRDESDRQGLRVVIELKRDVTPRQVLHLLYRHTTMQVAFSVNLLALVDNQPRTLTLKAALQHFLDHRQEVVTRRSLFELEKARQRAHVLEGLKIALDNLDEVIATIRRAQDADAARKALISKFKLSEIQAQAILDMQLRRLAALERKKILDELAEVRRLVASLEDLLGHPLKILYVIRDELEEIKRKYGDPRRTAILTDEPAEIDEEDLIPNQDVVVGLSARGYVRRLSVEVYRPQRRARGAGTGAIITREDDAVIHLSVANTRATMLFFTDRGKVYSLRVNDIPDAGKQSRGLPLNNFVSLDPQESVTALVPVRRFEEDQYLCMLTRAGEVKRIAVTDFENIRSSGLIAMALGEGDELRWVRLTKGNDELIVASEQGQTIRFNENEVRASGRGSGGVRAIRLDAGDKAAGMDFASRGTDFITATERGMVKRTAIEEYPQQGRGGGGVRGAKITDKTGILVAARVANVGDEVMVASAEGIVYRSAVTAIPRNGRSTLGVGLVRVAPTDKVVAMAVLYVIGDAKGPGKGGDGRSKASLPKKEPAPEPVAPKATSSARPKAAEPLAKPASGPAPATEQPTPVAVAAPKRAKPAAEAAVAVAAQAPAQPAGKAATAVAAKPGQAAALQAPAGKAKPAAAAAKAPAQPSAPIRDEKAAARAPDGKPAAPAAKSKTDKDTEGAKPATAPATKPDAPKASQLTDGAKSARSAAEPTSKATGKKAPAGVAARWKK
ncbi:MAG: DNA gyrase subunit A [Chloroflexi bacterium]|nr:DNA gyrase subunit A [Chloroflexota bacterium]